MLSDDAAKGAQENESGEAPDSKALQAELEKAKAELADKASRLDEANKQLMSEDYLRHLARQRDGGADDEDERPRRRAPQEEDEPVRPKKDIDEMSNRELAEFIVGTIRQDVGKVGKEIDREIGRLDTALVDMRTATEIDRVAAKYPDFWEHKDAILKLAKTNPHLTPLEAYKLVKVEHLEKSDAERRAADEKAKRRVVTERPSISSATTRGTAPKGFDKVFEEAWKTSVGD